MRLGQLLGHGNAEQTMAGRNIQDLGVRARTELAASMPAMACAGGNISGAMPWANSIQMGSSGARCPIVGRTAFPHGCAQLLKMGSWVGCSRNLNARPR